MLKYYSIPTCAMIALVAFVAATMTIAVAQSPNTSTMIVTVVDQNDAVVRGAKVSVVNTATGAVRDTVSGEEGSATIAALSLTGEYKVTVTMSGFTAEDVTGLTLRAGQTATVKVELVASGGKSEVTVLGTAEGVRADPQSACHWIASRSTRLQSSAEGLDAAALQFSVSGRGRDGGSLRSTRRTSSPALVRAARPRPHSMARNNDEAWGRQTMIATLPLGAIQEMTVLSNGFLAGIRLDHGPALNIVTKSGSQRFAR